MSSTIKQPATQHLESRPGDSQHSLESTNCINKLPLHNPETSKEGHNNANKREFSNTSKGLTMTDDDKVANEIHDDDDSKKRKKKSRSEKTSETVPTILGFDLPMDTSSTLIPPSKEGTAVFNEHDVLSGRGGGTNVHPGNRDFRDLINKYRTIYLKAKKNDKPAISRAIVKQVRSKGGRFLRKNDKGNLYYEIGDAQAREKTSQALRQRAPEIRKLMLEQQHFGGAPGSGIAGIMGGMGVLPPSLQPLNGVGTAAGTASTTTTADSGMGHSSNLPEEQFQMNMPLLSATGLQAGMEFHHPAVTGQLLAAGGGYNPAFYHAMMVGMGGGAGAGDTLNGAPNNVTAGGADAQQMAEMGSDHVLHYSSRRHHSQQSDGM
jgi:hypothetical protein